MVAISSGCWDHGLGPLRQRVQTEVVVGLFPLHRPRNIGGPGATPPLNVEVDSDPDGEGMGTRPGAQMTGWRWGPERGRAPAAPPWRNGSMLLSSCPGPEPGVEGTGCPCEFSLSSCGLSSPSLEVNKQGHAGAGARHPTGVGSEDLQGSFPRKSLILGLLTQVRPGAAGILETSRFPTHLQ